jgi:hypothetical protein
MFLEVKKSFQATKHPTKNDQMENGQKIALFKLNMRLKILER